MWFRAWNQVPRVGHHKFGHFMQRVMCPRKRTSMGHMHPSRKRGNYNKSPQSQQCYPWERWARIVERSKEEEHTHTGLSSSPLCFGPSSVRLLGNKAPRKCGLSFNGFPCSFLDRSDQKPTSYCCPSLPEICLLDLLLGLGLHTSSPSSSSIVFGPQF